MLPSLRKRVFIALGPSRLAVAHMERGWRPKAEEPVLLRCETSTGKPGWKAPVAALQMWLEKEELHDVDVCLTVSNCFAQFALVPWSDAIKKRSEREALSRIHFEALFGTAAADWEIELDMSRYEQPGIGCALEKAFIQSLEELCGKYRLCLASLQPHFIRSFNRWRGRIGENALVAVAEPGGCVLAGFQKGIWHSVRSVRMTGSLEESLPVLYERELLLQGLSEKTELVLHSVEKCSPAWLRQHKHITLLDGLEADTLQHRLLSIAVAGEA